MSLNAGTVQASAELNKSGFMRSLADIKKRGAKAMTDVEGSFQQLGRSMRRTGAIMTATVSAPIILGMKKMTDEAALLEGAMAKFNVVFGDASGEMESWVKEFRKEVPLATREIIQSAAAMQDLLVPMGIARDEATKMSQDWLTLASRLAAFNDVPVDQALEAIRSGVAGMSRPLRQFGIDARETAVQQEALAMGLISTTSEMDEQTRQQALLSLAYKQSKDAVEGYEEQTGSLLMIQQEFTASVKDLSASLGQELMPLMTKITQTATKMVKGLSDMSSGMKAFTLSTLAIGAAIGPFLASLGFMIGQMKNLIPLMKKVKGGVVALSSALKVGTTAMFGYVGAILALGVANFKANQRSKERVDAIDAEIAAISSIEEANQAFIATQQEMIAVQNRMAKGARGLGGQLEDLKQKEDALIQRMIELGSQKPLRGMTGEDLNEILNFMDFINADFTQLANTVARTNIAKPFIEAKQPIDDIIPALDMAEQGFREMTASEILADQGALNLGPRMEEVAKKADEASRAGERMGQILGGAFSQALVFGEGLLDTIKNIAKQLASRAIVNFLSMAMSPGGIGGLFSGGLFKGIGKLIGVNDALVQPNGNIVKFHPQDNLLAMKDFSKLNTGGVSEARLARAIGMELDKRMQRLGPKEVYTMGRAGEFQT